MKSHKIQIKRLGFTEVTRKDTSPQGDFKLFSTPAGGIYDEC